MSSLESSIEKTLVNARALLYRAWPNDGVIMRQTGVMNDPARTQYFFSSQHFREGFRYTAKLSRHRRLLAQSFVTDEFLAYAGAKLFFTKEPPSYRPEETNRRLADTSLEPYLFRYDDPDPDRRMYFSVIKGDFKPLVAWLEEHRQRARAGLCCVLNRYDLHDDMPLLAQRIRFVRAFVPHIDIYGRSPADHAPGWTEFPTYKGWVNDKMATMRNYTFNLCFENSDYDGYITEKAIEAMMGGAIPLYWGGGRYLAETLPAGAYIDCRDQQPEALLDRMQTMPMDEIIAYRQAAIAFLQSRAARRFTRGDWARRILARFQEQEADREIGRNGSTSR